MSGAVPPEYERFVTAARRSDQLPPAPGRLTDGQIADGMFVPTKQAVELLRVAARRAAGFFRPTKRTEVVWVEGDNELAVGIADVSMTTRDGLVVIALPVRCDQVGSVTVEVHLAVGGDDRPAGLYASTFRTPVGPKLVVDTWGEALVAFAWQCLLGLVSGLAGAVGKDARGNVLVPVEMSASRAGIRIVPMARHRFAGSSGLLTKAAPR